jgi:amanitin/phalloidin family toxin
MSDINDARLPILVIVIGTIAVAIPSVGNDVDPTLTRGDK